MKRTYTIFTALALVLGLSAIALASGHAEGHEHHIPWGNYVYRLINLAIVVGVIWKLAGKKIAGFFGGRRKQIGKDLDDLQVRQADAEKKLKDVEQSITNLEQEKQSILAEARAQGEGLKKAILDKAEADAERIREQAKRSAEFEAKAATDLLRAELAELVVEAARKIVQEQLSEKDHEKLVDEYLTKVVLN
ncbi:MAG: F0F1 ATP synthase subunit B [Desulfovibrionaceae bacterium]|nr:F0F1 ATP synthase subunit B [Desulfovibrionaceae bacterium]